MCNSYLKKENIIFHHSVAKKIIKQNLEHQRLISSKRSLIDKKFAPYALDADSQTDFVKIRIFDEYYHCDTMSQHFRDRLYVYVCSRNTSVTLARLGIRQPGAVDRSRRGVRPCRRHRRTLSEQSTRPDIQICTTRDLLITTSSSRL